MLKILKNSRLKLGLSLSAIALVMGCSSGADYASYSKIVVIGASLSDTGNVSAVTKGTIPGASYYNGRWSDGPLWIDLVGAELGLSVDPHEAGGNNYAYGGAKTCGIDGVKSDVPDMCQQAGMYLLASGGKADPNALYVIDAATVGNNISAVLASGGKLSPTLVTATAPQDISNLMTALYASGARRFLVTNAPDVGATPKVAAAGAAAVTAATQLSVGYNTVLAATLDKFKQTNKESSVKVLDLMDLGNKIKANPASYGINNTTKECLDTKGVVCATPATYQYWDAFHPTATIGRIFSNLAVAALQE